MRRETDLEQVKATAKMFLMMDIQETELALAVVKHPFTDSGIVLLPEPDSENETYIGNLLENSDILERWRETIAESIDQAENARDISYRITKPYWLAFLKYTTPHLSKDDFSRILAYTWTSCEFPNQDPNLSRKKLLAMFRRANPSALMEEDELAQLRGLEETVTVYRGTTSKNKGSINALSWTLSEETARWFAHRFGGEGTVYRANIRKEHIAALFNRRNEMEVIVDPKHLMDITELRAQETEHCFEQIL